MYLVATIIKQPTYSIVLMHGFSRGVGQVLTKDGLKAYI